MTKTKTFKTLLNRPGATIIPVAHDALTAKIIEKVGFEAVSVGGFAIAGVNFGLPDVGLIGLAEMVNHIGRIVDATSLPVFADADDGYGNARNVAHTIKQYERIGVASLFIEDQTHPKRCGHMDGKEIISSQEMAEKIKAAVRARVDNDLTICARTDARATHGISEAINRGHIYAQNGADIIFVEAPESVSELETIAREISEIPLLVNMLEGGKTPILPKNQLEDMGFKLIAYPVTTLFSALKAEEDALQNLMRNGVSDGNLLGFPEYKELVQLDKYL